MPPCAILLWVVLHLLAGAQAAAEGQRAEVCLFFLWQPGGLASDPRDGGGTLFLVEPCPCRDPAGCPPPTP